MIQNFLKITLRNLARNRSYAFISVFGLALGISSCLLIFMYVFDELSYDNYHEKGDRIYRLSIVNNFQGQMVTALSNYGAGPTLTNDYPEVENYVRFRGGNGEVQLMIDDKVFPETNIWLTDSTVFDVMSYNLLVGEKRTALVAPQTIVLTQSLKEKLFGSEDALGKQVKVNNTMATVTGVMADLPKNSDMPINGLLSMTTMPEQARATFLQDWFRIGFYTFILFDQKPDVSDFETKLKAFEEKYVQPWAEENQIVAGQEYKITPIEEVHFVQGLDFDLPKGNISYIWTFSLLAIFILIMASINYINLSLAQGAKRAKEVGVRKTLGAMKGDLMTQFLGESLLITVIAAVLGLAITELLMNTFNDVTGKTFTIAEVFNPTMMFTLIGIILLVGLLAGSYPALILSSFKPVRVLKGVIPNEGGVGTLQKSLILIQFVFSLFMITGTILIGDQMEFMRTMNLGFDRENVMIISLPADTNVGKRMPAWIEQLENSEGVVAVAHTNVPTGGGTAELMFRVERDGVLTEQNIKCFFADEHFVEVLGLDMLQGRNFNAEIATDETQAFIINDYAAKAFGWGDDALDKRMQWGLMANGQATNDGKVIGVMNNFHFLSLHKPMEPFVLCFNPGGMNMLTVRLAAGDFTKTIAAMEEEWNELAPNHEFNFNFLDELLDQNYQQEQSMGKLFNYFAVISVLIAALGLFALLSFSIQNRIKEIGIRKVLGASVANISWILVRDFFYLLLAAFALTTPVCIWLMNRWLEDFAYDTPLHPMSFVLALLLAIALAGITISYHVFRISKSDPINALRYE
ncbi:MAG: FtsX-like permease family protein [Flavobacteriales bacterium]